MLKRLINRLTGGRPMTREDFRFVDVVSGRPIYRYRDAYGRLWLAEDRWGWFRVRIYDVRSYEKRKR